MRQIPHLCLACIFRRNRRGDRAASTPSQGGGQFWIVRRFFIQFMLVKRWVRSSGDDPRAAAGPFPYQAGMARGAGALRVVTHEHIPHGRPRPSRRPLRYTPLLSPRPATRRTARSEAFKWHSNGKAPPARQSRPRAGIGVRRRAGNRGTARRVRPTISSPSAARRHIPSLWTPLRRLASLR